MPSGEKIILRVGETHGFEFQCKQNDVALFASLGSALAEIQAFETHIEGLLEALSQSVASGEEASIKNPDRFYSRTLGMLIKQFQKHLPDTGIAELLENVREKRNYLVHRILRVSGWPLMNDEDYIRAIKEIEAMRAYIETAAVEVSRYLANRSLLSLIVLSIDRETGEVKQIV